VKLIILFLTKLGVLLKLAKYGKTIISMLLMIVSYAFIYGWKFAVGFVLLIFFHETGHVMAARSVGIKTSAPMFIPFVGAFIKTERESISAMEEFIIAAGGPLAGMAAAFLCYFLGNVVNSELLIALAFSGLIMNLFNLMPFGFMDGGRMASTLSVWMWGIGLVAFFGFAFWSGNAMLFIFLILGIFHMYEMITHPERIEKIRAIGSERQLFASVYIGMILLGGWGSFVVYKTLQHLKGIPT